VRTPRVVGIIAALALLYGAWLVEPRWITGALGLLVLYALLTNVPRAAELVDQATGGLAAAFAPAGSGGHSRGGTF
jgi:hypothetical protein